MSESTEEAERRLVTTCCERPETIEVADVATGHFQSPKWRSAWAAMVELYAQDRTITDVSIMEQVSMRFPGRIGLADLVNLDGNRTMVAEYARIVRQGAERRQLMVELDRLRREAEGLEPEQILEAMTEVARTADVGGGCGGSTIGDLAKERFKEYSELADQRSNGDSAVTGIPTGIAALDDMLGGLQPGIVTLLAARPGMGKSTLALNITANMTREGVGVHVFSLEEPRAHYMDRVFCLASKVGIPQLRTASFSRGELDQVQAAGSRIMLRKNWVVDDRSAIRAEDIIRAARLRQEANATRVVVVDYINILRRQPGEAKKDMIDNAVNAFADAAKRDGIAYLVLAQLNRGLEGRDNPEPRLSDLKETGTLEERAKAVLMLHHPHEYDKTRRQDVVQILVEKNSQGERGIVECAWHPERMYVGDRRGS